MTEKGRKLERESQIQISTRTSPSLFTRTVVMLSATNHFCPFITMLDGGSCVAPISADHTITLAPTSSLAVRWNLKTVSRAPALRIICQPLRLISCCTSYRVDVKCALTALRFSRRESTSRKSISRVSKTALRCYLIALVGELDESSLRVRLRDLDVTFSGTGDAVIGAAVLLALLQQSAFPFSALDRSVPGRSHSAGGRIRRRVRLHRCDLQSGVQIEF